MAYEDQAIIVNGETYLKMDPRRAPIQTDDTTQQNMIADLTEAIQQAHEANTDTPVDPAVPPYLAQCVWFRFTSLRPTQFEALIALTVERERFDASLISMVTGIPVSQVKSAHRKYEKDKAAKAAKAQAEQAQAPEGGAA